MRVRLRYFIMLLAMLIVLSSMTAVAAMNTVPPTQLDVDMISFQINHLRPSACAGLSLSNLVTGSGTLTGTEGNDLILASDSADVIDGLGGSDCVMGGEGTILSMAAMMPTFVLAGMGTTRSSGVKVKCNSKLL